jgi:hypothetical protein
MSQYISNRTQVVNKTAIYFLTQVITAFLVYFGSYEVPFYVTSVYMEWHHSRKETPQIAS